MSRNQTKPDPLTSFIKSGDLAEVKSYIDRGNMKVAHVATHGYLALAVRSYLKSPTEDRKKILGLIVRDINTKKQAGQKVSLFPSNGNGRTAVHELAEHAQTPENYRYVRSLLQGLDKTKRAWPLAIPKQGKYAPRNSQQGARGLHRASSILFNREWYNLGNENRPKKATRSVLNKRNNVIQPALPQTNALQAMFQNMGLNRTTGVTRRQTNAPTPPSNGVGRSTNTRRRRVVKRRVA